MNAHLNHHPAEWVGDRTVSLLVNAGYFMLGGMILPLFTLTGFGLIALMQPASEIAALMNASLAEVALGSFLAGGVLGLLLRHRLAEWVFGQERPLD